MAYHKKHHQPATPGCKRVWILDVPRETIRAAKRFAANQDSTLTWAWNQILRAGLESLGELDPATPVDDGAALLGHKKKKRKEQNRRAAAGRPGRL